MQRPHQETNITHTNQDLNHAWVEEESQEDFLGLSVLRKRGPELKRARLWILCVMRREKGMIKRHRQDSNANGSASAATVGAADTSPLQILPHGFVLVVLTFVVVEETVVDDELVVVVDDELVVVVDDEVVPVPITVVVV